MDIPCEKCQTVYELDGKLIKSSGTLVRCSKCRAVFKVYPPDTADRRKFPRAKTRNLIAHITVDRDGAMLSQGLGKALDISKGGMLLETLFPVEKGMLSLMAVDKDHSLFEMKAELVYCKKTSSGMYHSGIKFTGNDSQVKESIIKLIKEYNHRKKMLSVAIQF